MIRSTHVFLIVLALLVVMGCSGNSSNPVVPAGQETDLSLLVAEVDESRINHQLLGMWTMEFDLESLTATITQDRSITHYNITTFLPAPLVTINSYDPQTEVIDVDITITNPYILISGYDVRVIIYTDYVGHMLQNADDWTALYDISGGLPINPFKAYAKGEMNRLFAGLTQHTENFLIHLPGGNLAFTFAIDASFPGNCKEPYEINDFTQGDLAPFTSASTEVEVTVLDWQEDVNAVDLFCPAITGMALFPFTQIDPEKWGETLVNNTGATEGNYVGYLIAYSSNSDLLALYDQVIIQVSDEGGWAQTWGGTGSDTGAGVAVDSSGNTYVTGQFQGTVDFDPGPGVDEHTAVLYADAFLSKFDSNGDFQWALTWSANGGAGVAVDGSSNIYVAGTFIDTVDFDPGPGTDNHSSHGHSDFFLSKFDSDGDFQWALTWGGPDVEYQHGIAVDDSDNVYFAGGFCSTVDFDPGPGTDNQSAGGWRAFCLSKFDSNGDYQWARTWGGGFSYHNSAVGATADNSGNAYVVGHFYGNVDFDPGPGTDYHSPNGEYDACLSKFDSNGDFQWALTWGGSECESANGVAAYDPDNIYVTGGFKGTVDLDPGAGIEEHSSNGGTDAFVSKFDASGDFQWALTWGGSDHDYAGNIAAYDPDNIYITGGFRGTVDLDPGPGVDDHTSNGEYDASLSKFDSSGDYQWALTWGGLFDDPVYGIAMYNLDSIYVTGYFQETVDFDPGPGVDEHTSNGDFDAFLSKFLSDS
jgi:hypothetical protein